MPNVAAGRSAACALYARGPLPTLAGAGTTEALWPVGDRVRLRVLRHAVDPPGMFAGAS